MTKTKIVVLLSIVALLASLPLTVALAQGLPPYQVIGKAMVDGEPAMMDTMVVAMVGETKVGESMVINDQGQYSLQITGGNPGDTVMFSLMMGEGDDAMEYMATTAEAVIRGPSGDLKKDVDLMAYSGEQPDPAATPAPTLTAAQEREAMRGPSGRQGVTGRSWRSWR